jgi:hypothetical protein
MKIHAVTPYPSGVKLEVVVGRKLVKSAILPYEEALEDLKRKVEK